MGWSSWSARLRQAQHYNGFVVGVFSGWLQRNSALSRVGNVGLWVLFHVARRSRRLRSRLRAARRGIVLPGLPQGGVGSAVHWRAPLTLASRPSFGRRVLIIAELSLRQCRKYRVDQKVDFLHRLGLQATVLPWQDFEACRRALQTHGMVVFYRTPAFDDVVALTEEARRLGLVSFFDLDDLIFDADEYARNSNVAALPADERDVLMNGVRLYRAMMSLVDHCIASTPTLVVRMQALVDGRVFLLENALDTHLLDLASVPCPGRDPATVVIGYGSGTTTHDADFMSVAPALLRIMEDFPQVRLAVYGHLCLPDYFEARTHQIVRIPLLDADDYYQSLSRFDISLAPLERNVFNDAKSNIKFLEAALFGVPSVCSPGAAFMQVVNHGVNGFLASNDDEWYATLRRLVEDVGLRQHVGDEARRGVLEQYHPEHVATRQMAPILDCGLPPVESGRAPRLKVLVVNVLYAPTSFGGATVVAEKLAEELAANNDVAVTVFAGSMQEGLAPYALVRYEWQGIPVIAVGIPGGMSPEESYHHPRMAECFREVLETVRPDVVHFHSIQQLGANLASPCTEMGIPYVITLHDAWWLCERQFMVKADGNYCHQEGVRMLACRGCMTDPAFSHRRYHRLWRILADAALLLAPSEFHRALHVKSGLSAAHVAVNKNGINLPAQDYRHGARGRHLRFAYLGGRAEHKGYFRLKQIFESLPESNYSLVLVDIERRLAVSGVTEDDWRIKGELEIVPPFEQTQLDEFFANVDVLLFPSAWKESFGLTVREAMSRDVWVIATDCGGPAEDIVDGVNGKLVAMGDLDGLRDAIRGLLQQPERLDDYRNPHKDDIRGFREQASELARYLRQIVASGQNRAD